MKRLFLFMLCVGLAIPTFSQDSDIEKYQVEIKEISSPDFEWTQFDNDKGECKFRKGVLELECKDKNSDAFTTTELEFDPANVDYIIVYQLKPDDIDDIHPFGIIFDYKDAKNYKLLRFGKKQFQLLTIEGGDKAVVKEGLYKVKDKKQVQISMKKKGKRLDFYIGSQYLPLTTLRNTTIQHSNIGFYVENKTKVQLTGVGYRLILGKEEETE